MAELSWSKVKSATLQGSDEGDWIKADDCDRCTIFGYGGDDTVRIYGCDYTIFYAGDGDNDIDWKSSNYSTISSGAGNDTINIWLGDGTGYHVLCGDGNDSVWGRFSFASIGK